MKRHSGNYIVLTFPSVLEAMEASKALDSLNIENQFIGDESHIMIDNIDKNEALSIIEDGLDYHDFGLYDYDEILEEVN